MGTLRHFFLTNGIDPTLYLLNCLPENQGFERGIDGDDLPSHTNALEFLSSTTDPYYWIWDAFDAYNCTYRHPIMDWRLIDDLWDNYIDENTIIGHGFTSLPQPMSRIPL